VSEYVVTNPTTGERVKEYPTISDAALVDAIAAADRAHREWSRATTIEERAALVRRVGELHTERRDELAAIIVREMGKPVEQALGEVDFCAAIYEYYADNATSLLADEPIAEVDTENADLILAALWDVVGRGGAVLAATHNPEALRYANRVVLFRDGVIDAEGSPDELADHLTTD